LARKQLTGLTSQRHQFELPVGSGLAGQRYFKMLEFRAAKLPVSSYVNLESGHHVRHAQDSSSLSLDGSGLNCGVAANA
jgi:hypothetical protein